MTPAPVLLGLALGLRHAFEPDHVAAVTAAIARGPHARGAARLGALWGGGHAVTVLAVGGALVLSGLTLPPRVAAVAEGVVGLILMALGIDLLRALAIKRGHLHVHAHDGSTHAHLHAHGDAHASSTTTTGGEHPHGGRRAALLGMAHGLSGSAGLALLAAASTGSRGEGILFLAAFALGAAVAMAAATAALAATLRFTRFERGRPLLWLRAASGALAVAVGAMLVAEFGLAWLAG